MTQSYSTSESWSYSHARDVAGKVAADLLGMQQEYGDPDNARIDRYLAELTILLAGGYVKEATYGYHRDNKWVAALRYTADMSGNLQANDRSGRIPRGADVTGARFTSVMEYSDKWDQLTYEQQERVKRELPFQRGAGDVPTVQFGSWTPDKSYSALGCGLLRGTIKVAS